LYFFCKKFNGHFSQILMDKPEILHVVNEQVPEDVLEPLKTDPVEVLIKDGARASESITIIYSV